MFAGTLVLGMEQNNDGKWEFTSLKTLAQGGESGGGENGGGEDGQDKKTIYHHTHKVCEYQIIGVANTAVRIRGYTFIIPVNGFLYLTLPDGELFVYSME